MVLHSWGGCRELLLKGSSFFEHNQRAARLWEPLRRGKAAPGASSAAVPWPGQELSLLWGESPIFIIPECPGDAPCPPSDTKGQVGWSCAQPG